TRELNEALEQQKAAAEVLKIISTSPTELQPVLDVVVRSAARFCSADDVTIFELDGQALHIAAHWGAVLSQEIGVRFPCTRGSGAGRTVIDRKPVHVIDLQSEAEEFPEGYAFAKRLGQRTTAGVPLLREGVAIGTIQLRRTEVNPFTDKQVALLQNFAAQAVIAIENARLLHELRESLQQQTATADVLKVISRSAFDLQTVLNTLTESAAQLCNADMAGIARPMEGGFYYATDYNFPADWLEFVRNRPLMAGRGSVVGRTLLEGKITQVADVLSDPDYTYREQQQKGGYRTFLAVPLLREGQPIGVLGLGRKRVDPFTDKQIELLATFADQAVIAIENVRLFQGEQQRTRELSESLEQQTATSEVLRVISTSSGELAPVFESLLASAKHLCGAEFGIILLREGDAFRTVALHGATAEYTEARWRAPLIRPAADTGLGRVLVTKQVGQIPDVQAVAGYVDNPVQAPIVQLAGVRSKLTVPMLEEEDLIGVIAIDRQEVRPFTDKQIALVQNFAAQAIIAIENARLLNELRQRTTDLAESLEQQTATSGILDVISNSPTDSQPAFDAIVRSALKLFPEAAIMI